MTELETRDKRLEDFSDSEIITWVRKCEATGDAYRWSAARGYAYLHHERGLSLRAIARRIGRSHAHIGRMVRVWDTHGGTHCDTPESLPTFSELEHGLANPKKSLPASNQDRIKELQREIARLRADEIRRLLDEIAELSPNKERQDNE